MRSKMGLILEAQAENAGSVWNIQRGRFGDEQQARNLTRQPRLFSNVHMLLQDLAVQASIGSDEIDWRSGFGRRRLLKVLNFVP